MSEQHVDIKFFEIRDRATFLPMFAFSTNSDRDDQKWLLRRAGYSPDSELIMFGYLGESGKDACYSPFDWNDRTKQCAHRYIQENWHKLRTGDVIDVEFILGETTKKKTSERYDD